MCVLRDGGSKGLKLSSQAGFTLPFAVPAAIGRRSSGHERYSFLSFGEVIRTEWFYGSSASNISLYHCCR